MEEGSSREDEETEEGNREVRVKKEETEGKEEDDVRAPMVKVGRKEF